MIVYATKISVKKTIAGVLALGAVACGAALLAPEAAKTAEAQTVSETVSKTASGTDTGTESGANADANAGTNTGANAGAESGTKAKEWTIESKLSSNEDRVALLESYGWHVNPEPLSEREVQIPKTFDETYQAYNAIQQAQGLDLAPYQGKRATLYTYELLEYPTGATGVTANLLIRRKHLIAADISAAEADGFVHGITQLPQ